VGGTAGVGGTTGGTAGIGGSTSTGGDACDGGPARNLTIREVAAYQTIKIPIATGQQAIPAGSRVADVVQRRDTLFRVFVDVQAWSPRTLSARVTLINGATQEQFFERKALSTSSVDADPATSFQVRVPANRIQGDTRYFVEVVECGASSGGSIAPRFPGFGEAALGARATGPLKVRLVPVSTNLRIPDTSEPVLSLYREYLRSMYPVESVELGVTSALSTPYPVNWNSLLDQVRAKRQSELAPPDVYYYGILMPHNSLTEYVTACRGCPSGLGYVATATSAGSRVAIGLGFGDVASARTMAHELGHNHGRRHTPCGTSDGDPSFPHAGGVSGVWGYEARTGTLHDPRTPDIMGYCNPRWISDFTYRGLLTRVATLNGAAFEILADEASIARWRVLIAEPTGPRWGIPFDRPAAPFGEAESADVLDAQGRVITKTTVYRTEMGDSDAFTVLVPEPRPEWSSVRILGSVPLAFTAR
jgi:hypothetical protein